MTTSSAYVIENMAKCWCQSDAAEAILLGFQHYLVMLGTTVLIPTALVPQMGGGNVSFSKLNILKINNSKWNNLKVFS